MTLDLAPFWPGTSLLLLAAALLLEALLGYPAVLYRLLRHPVVWIGALIACLDRHLNRASAKPSTRRLMGVVALLLLLLAVALPSVALTWWLGRWFWGLAVLALLASTLLAQRSLASHVRAVAEGLERDGLEGGRKAVGQIVGRNPQLLDEHGVARAALESLSENFSDGVVAPALWCGLGGLPGIALYKAINTADSMIGHRTPRHEAFGWASARLDDLVNLPASRLAALWLLLAAMLLPDASPRGAWRTVWRDARKHRSPNAGWPEAALAGALGLKLNGPRVYGTTRRNDAWTGDGRADCTAADIRRGLKLYWLACGVQAVVACAAAAVWLY